MTTVIKSNKLITDASKPPIAQGVVVIDGDTIVAVGAPDTIEIPPDSSTIDCTQDTVMPGLIDSHAHITANTKYRLPLKEHYTLDVPTAVLRGAMSLRDDLASGVTTMRTCGDKQDWELRFKEAIEREEIPGPRLVICIRAFRPSHGTAKFLAFPADGVDELRKRIRENFSMGADFVKLFVTNVMNGEMDDDYRRGDLTGVPAYTREELAAAADEAHRLGMKIAGHAIGGPGMRWAMEVGFDSVEHANLLEEEDIGVFVKYGTYLSDPNLQLFFDGETGFPSRDNWKQDWWREKVIRARDLTGTHLPQAVKSGVKVCLATDSTHGYLWKETKYLVELGASHEDALLAVTKNSAELLGVADRIGTLEPGKLADVISVQGDPLEDIGSLKDVKLVMKDGRVYDNLP